MPTSPALSNNLVTTPSRTQNWNQFDVRVDHTQSDRNNFLGRYSWSKTSTINPYTFAPVQLQGVSKAVGLGNEDTFAGPSDLWAEHAVFGWVHVFSSRLLLDTRAGYNHFNLEFTQADVVTGDQLGEQLGVPNANQQLGQDGIPIFSPANYTGIGHSRSLPIFRHEKTFQYVTNLTFQGEKHTIKTGFDLRRRHMGEFQTNRGNGRFNFSPNITNNPVTNAGGHVDGLVSARSAEPDRAGLSARVRRGDAQHRIRRLHRRRLACDAEADVEPRPEVRARYAVHRSRQPVGELRPQYGNSPRRGAQRREQISGREHLQEGLCTSPRFCLPDCAAHGRARRSGHLLEHTGQRRRGAAVAPARAIRADLQLQSGHAVRDAARRRTASPRFRRSTWRLPTIPPAA